MRADEPGLLTDLYELTMAQAYYQQGMFSPATFSLMIRNYPPDRGYFVSAGLEDVLRYLEAWSFPPRSIEYLASTGIFSADFLDYLGGLGFTGDVWAVPEGRVFFKDEPILEVTAPIIEAQIVETYVINRINFQSLIATKAARCTWAARGRPLVDFSFRRTQGIDAGMKAARAAYIAGFRSTSNVMAGKLYGIPVAGTMAHSFVSSHEDEADAFRHYASSFPGGSTFLIDTYDTIAGAEVAVKVAREMEASGQRLQAVRLDSGDLAALSREVRGMLDQEGLDYIRIFASGGLDEYDVEDLADGGAPIDAFGIGTKLGVSGDAPWSDMAYKLVEYAGRPVLKLSTGKLSLPGRKQVLRLRDDGGTFAGDVIGLREEPQNGGERLLEKVMEDGKTLGLHPSLDEIRERFKKDFSRLDDRFKALRKPPEYAVTLSARLEELDARVRRQQASKSAGEPG